MDWNTLLTTPAAATALRITLIVALSLVAGWLLRRAARLLEQRLAQSPARSPERAARLRTLVGVSRSAAYVLVFGVAGLMVLHALAIDILPLLASLGVASLALSLGAQTLIKDMIGGLLILIEDQFAVGDVIRVGEVSGEVERITLRVTYLRDLEGRQHIVPNGDVRTVSNLTAEWARAVVDLDVGYEADMAAVMRALRAAAEQVAGDAALKADLLEAPQALGWVAFKDWAVQVRLQAKTAPGKQWGVMTALRQQALAALRAEGVVVGAAAPVRLDRPKAG